jgi:hypothetical protein
MANLKQQAAWRKTEYPDAAASLLEGLEETFTVNRLKLTPSLMRCLASTNVIENPNGAVRRGPTVSVATATPRWRYAGRQPDSWKQRSRSARSRVTASSGCSALHSDDRSRRLTSRPALLSL